MDYKVYEDILGTAHRESISRAEVLAINWKQVMGKIFIQQYGSKKKITILRCTYMREKNLNPNKIIFSRLIKIKTIEIFGLIIGSRGIIPKLKVKIGKSSLQNNQISNSLLFTYLQKSWI